MGSSLKLFSVHGISIRMHITFPLILVWAAIQFGALNDGGVIGAVFGVIVVLLLFVIVTLHELGHSFAALRYGVPVDRIVLLPIGGVAQLKRIPENPVQELIIAIAGPAVNFVLAILFGAVAVAFNISVANLFSIFSVAPTLTFESIFLYTFFYNLFLGVFNLLPAFPMDGGRILRALLATRIPYGRATAVAVSIGRGIAFLMGLYGFLGGGFFIIILAIFVYMGASQEGAMVQVRTVLRGLRVRQVYSQNVTILSPENTLQDAVNITLSSFQASFPICREGNLEGLLSYPQLVQALNQHGPNTPVSIVMQTNVPTVTPQDELYKVQQQLQAAQVEAFPVVEDGQFLGLITARDISEVYNLLSVDPDLLVREDESTLPSPVEPSGGGAIER